MGTEETLDELDCCCREHLGGRLTSEERWSQFQNIMDSSSFSPQELIEGWSKREASREDKADNKSSGDGA